MIIENKVNYLIENIERQIESFGNRKNDNKKKAFWFKMLTTIFSVAITILLGLQGFQGEWLIIIKNIALILSAFVTLFSVWDAFFGHRSLWITYSHTSNQLKSLKSHLEYLTLDGTQNVNETEIDDCYKKYQSILDEANRFWLNLRDENSTKKL